MSCSTPLHGSAHGVCRPITSMVVFHVGMSSCSQHASAHSTRGACTQLCLLLPWRRAAASKTSLPPAPWLACTQAARCSELRGEAAHMPAVMQDMPAWQPWWLHGESAAVHACMRASSRHAHVSVCMCLVPERCVLEGHAVSAGRKSHALRTVLGAQVAHSYGVQRLCVLATVCGRALQGLGGMGRLCW